MPFLLGLPLVYGLETDRPEGFALQYDVPSSLADRLRRGELDVALIPVVEFFHQPVGAQGLAPLQAVPGLCVGCDGPVESIRLFHRCRVEEVRRVALDLSSRTAAALVRVLFEGFWGSRPDYVGHRPDLSEMLAQADAALLIGDNALQEDADVPYIDCGAEWKRQTGLPFVFALWGIRSEIAAQAPRIAEVLHRSYARGKECLDQIAAEQAQARGMEREAVARYLGESIRYELTEATLRGLARFRELGIELGIFPEDGPELRFI